MEIMAGLGPNNTSLLERVGKQFEMTLDWLEMDRQERGQARRLAVIRYGMKHKKQQKPTAPVRDKPKMKGYERQWIWEGKSMESKGMIHGQGYSGTEIRNQGFKLPKLEKKGKI